MKEKQNTAVATSAPTINTGVTADIRGVEPNHNTTAVSIKSGIKAGTGCRTCGYNHNETAVRIKSGIKAGTICRTCNLNHNETMVRIRSGIKASTI